MHCFPHDCNHPWVYTEFLIFYHAFHPHMCSFLLFSPHGCFSIFQTSFHVFNWIIFPFTLAGCSFLSCHLRSLVFPPDLRLYFCWLLFCTPPSRLPSHVLLSHLLPVLLLLLKDICHLHIFDLLTYCYFLHDMKCGQNYVFLYFIWPPVVLHIEIYPLFISTSESDDVVACLSSCLT